MTFERDGKDVQARRAHYFCADRFLAAVTAATTGACAGLLEVEDLTELPLPRRACLAS